MQVASEVIADGGKRRGALRRTFFPSGLHVGQGRVNFRARRGEEADHRVFRAGDLGLGIVRLVEPPLHIRLTAADPDLSDQHVLQFDLVLAVDGERERAAGFEWL